MHYDWSRKPNPERLTQLAEWVLSSQRPLNSINFENWLPELAYEHDRLAACPHGDDHPCNNGLGRWLGIEPFGQGSSFDPVHWSKQRGYSAERLNRLASPMWRAAVLAAPFETQKRMIADMLLTLRDTGEFVYDYTNYSFGQDRPVVQTV